MTPEAGSGKADFRPSHVKWRTEPNGELSAEVGNYQLLVQTLNETGGAARFRVLRRGLGMNPGALVSSGIKEDVRGAMAAAEEIAERCAGLGLFSSSLSVPARLRPRVLIVEDDEMVNDVLHEMLTGHFEITCVTRVREALTELLLRRVDIILLDYRLADGTGQIVAAQAAHAGLPVVWMTGDPETIKGHDEVPRFVLPKPSGIRVVLEVLREALLSNGCC